MTAVCEASETLVVTERRIYALSMAKFVSLRIKGQDGDVRVKADTVEEDGAHLVLKDGAQTVGKYRTDEVQGWHIIESASRQL